MSLNEAIMKAQEYLGFRKQAYQQVFQVENRYAREVLEDLAKFCRAHETTFNPDPRAHALLEGRREAFLRIQQHLQLSNEDLWKLYGKGK